MVPTTCVDSIEGEAFSSEHVDISGRRRGQF